MRPIEGDLLAHTAPPVPPDTPAGGADDDAGPDAALEPLHRLPPDVQRLLDEARGHPGWSSIGEEPAPDARREALVGALAQALFAVL